MSEIQNADIDWLEGDLPFSRQFQDIYFSSQGGTAESQHVFIRANRLADRLRLRDALDKPFCIVELGFGSGLNFLLCWQLLESLPSPRPRLHYLAFEKHPMTAADLCRAQRQWPELAVFSRKLQSQILDHTAGLHRFQLQTNLTLDLFYGDAEEGLKQVFAAPRDSVDCWFLDGFAPARNPDLWSNSLAGLIGSLSRPDATASTYSVAGQVRRSLAGAGFTLSRQPGFGRKREMLLAERARPGAEDSQEVASAFPGRAAWYLLHRRTVNRKHAAIIGGGMAGCSTAYSLARKGWQVTLIESAADIAGGASGNIQGVLQPRLAASASEISRFHLHALLFASRQYHQLQLAHDIGWHPCGVLRLATSQRHGLNSLLVAPGKYYDPRVLATVTRQQAGTLAGLPVTDQALWIPHGGWLRPSSLCHSYLSSIPPSQLTLLVGQQAVSLAYQDGRWLIEGSHGPIAEAETVVLCNSHLANRYEQTAFLPLQPVRGQMTSVCSDSRSQSLTSVVVRDRYMCPADGAVHGIGASYQTGVCDLTLNSEDDSTNLSGINQIFALKPPLDLLVTGARASVRCNTTDYFPVVGAVPDYQDFLHTYGELSRNAQAEISQSARYQPGLYVNSGHGSYGLASCPLAGEFLASLIADEALPVTTAIADSLSPARFIIREMKKQQIGVDQRPSE